MKQQFAKLDINAPVILGYTALCLVALLVDVVTQGASDKLLFTVYPSSMADPFFYIRLVGHVVGHADWNHFLSNFMMILLLGPMLEEKYGSLDILMMILITGLITGICTLLFFPGVALKGASGVVFAMILASSMTGLREGKIPLTFVLVALLYLGREVSSLFVNDNISQSGHILGGIIGAGMANLMSRHRQ